MKWNWNQYPVNKSSFEFHLFLENDIVTHKHPILSHSIQHLYLHLMQPDLKTMEHNSTSSAHTITFIFSCNLHYCNFHREYQSVIIVITIDFILFFTYFHWIYPYIKIKCWLCSKIARDFQLNGEKKNLPVSTIFQQRNIEWSKKFDVTRMLFSRWSVTYSNRLSISYTKYYLHEFSFMSFHRKLSSFSSESIVYCVKIVMFKYSSTDLLW